MDPGVGAQESALIVALHRYAPVLLGLAIGTAAKYGLTISEGRTITWRGLLGDMLLLGMLGMLAIVGSDIFGLTGDARVLVGAMAAVSGDRAIRLVRRSFERAIEQQATRLVATAGETVTVPPAKSAVEVQFEEPGNEAQAPFRELGRRLSKLGEQNPNASLAEILKQIDREDDK